MAFDTSPAFVAPVRAPGQARLLYRDTAKRVLDGVLLGLFAIPVALLVAVLAVLVALDGGAPFFAQRRVGMGGRVFTMWKLRTMVPDAEERLAALLANDPQARAEWETAQKLTHDPRITWLGRILRKTSLDELPQLLNVLRGEMSLVGPRPMLPEQRPLYPGTDYYMLRPGLSGYWQIAERNETSFAERAGFDAAYAREMSFVTDVRVIAMTVFTVVGATGR